MAGHSLDRADLRARIDKALASFLADAEVTLLEAGPDLGPVIDAVRDLVGSGKRLRPAFCYWGWRGAGGGDDDAAVAAATSLELLHACAIVHDDVMDRADIRRGMPSIHRLFTERHRDKRWVGDPDRFGDSAAILIGDLCLAWSDDMFAGCGLPALAVAAARAPYDAMRTEVMAGQYLDLLEQVRGTSTIEGAMRVVRLKSAKYTVERPLHVGARLAGAPDALLDAYSAYGIPLGEAFQLRDDVLGVFGDPAVTGKPAGDDLREGKRTVLLATALSRSSGDERATLERLVGDPRLDADGIESLRTVIREVGALDEVERLIERLTTAAHDALVTAPIADEARTVLGELAVAATSRIV